MKTKTYGLQNETRQYLRRLYAYGRELRGADVADLDDFVKGLKQLGLWGNTVCWPMRSIHNIGTGSRVLALGGYNRNYDGTMMNSMAWGTNGMVKANATDHILLDGSSFLKPMPFSLFLCFKANTIAANQNLVVCSAGGVTGSYYVLNLDNITSKQFYIAMSRGSVMYYPTVANPTGREQLYNFFSATETPTTHQQEFNGTAGSVATGLATYNPVGVARPNIGGLNVDTRGVFPFLMLTNTNTPMALHTNLYALYKTTIGKNLGLI
jgi:hypothetical protein